jgi:TrmH family RNA methyltransferase
MVFPMPLRKTPQVPTSLSPHSPKLEAVRELLTPRGRRAAGAFGAEGATLLAEADRAGLVPREVYATPAALERFDSGRYESEGIPVYSLPERLFARLSDLETPSGLLGIFALPDHAVADVLARPGVVLLLAGVADPGNAGTLVRSAEAFGAAGVLFGRGGVDSHAPKVVRSAMGALFRVAVASVSADELAAAAVASGRPIVATDSDGEDLRTADLPANAIIAVGNERRGVGDWLGQWDRTIRIPYGGPTESLNAAVAGSIVLYEFARVK